MTDPNSTNKEELPPRSWWRNLERRAKDRNWWFPDWARLAEALLAAVILEVVRFLLPRFWDALCYPVPIPIGALVLLWAVSVYGVVRFLFRKQTLAAEPRARIPWSKRLRVRLPFYFCIGFLAYILSGPHGEKRPRILYRSPVASGEAAGNAEVWSQIAANLQTELERYFPGTTVTNETTSTTGDQIDKLRSGRIDIAALGAGTAATAALDPWCHFFPGFVLCDTNKSPIMYSAKLIVRSNNPATAKCSTSSDLWSLLHENPDLALALGDWPSLSSCKIVKLTMTNLSNRQLVESHLPQGKLIEAVAKGELPTGKRIIGACVASDTFERFLDQNRQYRDSFKWLPWQPPVMPSWSNSFPSVVIGWRSDLPVLAQLCIAHTLKRYSWPSNSPYTTINGPQVGGFGAVDDFLDLWARPIEITEDFKRKFPQH